MKIQRHEKKKKNQSIYNKIFFLIFFHYPFVFVNFFCLFRPRGSQLDEKLEVAANWKA